MKKEITVLVNCYGILPIQQEPLSAINYLSGLFPQLASQVKLFIICSRTNYKNYSCYKNAKVIVLKDISAKKLQPYYKQADLFFCFSNSTMPADIPYTLPVICFVVDSQRQYDLTLSHETGLAEINRDFSHKISRANGILTISRWERDFIQRTFNVENVRAIPLAPYLKDRQGSFESNLIFHSKFDQYFIYPARSDLYKNHYNLISAFAILHSDPQTRGKYNLVLTHLSSDPNSAEMWNKKINDCPHAKEYIEVLANISDKELYDLLSQAKGMLFPPLYESYAGNILDAMEMGLPIMASKAADIMETCGDDIEYFNDVYDPYKMAKEIQDFSGKIDSNHNNFGVVKQQDDNYCNQKVVDELLAFFDSVLEQSKSKHNFIHNNVDRGATTCHSENKLTIMIDFNGDFKQQIDVAHFSENFNMMLDNVAKNYNVICILSYHDKVKFDQANLLHHETASKMRFSYYRNGNMKSYLLALEYALNYLINTRYFFCTTFQQILDIDFKFIAKSMVDLDYFEDIYSAKLVNDGKMSWRREDPVSNDVLAIKEYENYMGQHQHNNVIKRFHNRIIRTQVCRERGMIGSIQSISDDISSYSNIVHSI